MKCPVCGVDMIVVEHQKIEIDYCVKCSGVWFDCGELELLLHAATGKAPEPGCGLDLTEAISGEKKRRCPICRQKMKKVLLGKQPEVLIDECPRGEGLWFDGGELQSIVGHLAGQAESESARTVVSYLGDVFKPAGRSRSGGTGKEG